MEEGREQATQACDVRTVLGREQEDLVDMEGSSSHSQLMSPNVNKPWLK